MRIVDADESHLEAIRAITNEVIANTTAIYDDDPVTEADSRAWFEAKQARGYPVLVAVDDADEVLGFASYGEFNKKPGYRHTVEHSIHVAATHRGKGLGRRLLEAIEQRARRAGMHAMVGLIDADNAASRRLHTSAGYTLAGTLPEVGRKFDRWLAMTYYHKLLD